MNIKFFIIGLLFILSPLTLLFFEEDRKYKAPCVDGEGDVNLEGIMCLKTEYTTFGVDSGIMLIPSMFIIMTGLLILISSVVLN